MVTNQARKLQFRLHPNPLNGKGSYMFTEVTQGYPHTCARGSHIHAPKKYRGLYISATYVTYVNIYIYQIDRWLQKGLQVVTDLFAAADAIEGASGDEPMTGVALFAHWESRLKRRSVMIEGHGWVDLWPVAQYLAEVGDADDMVDAMKDPRGYIGMVARLAIARGVIQARPGAETTDGDRAPWSAEPKRSVIYDGARYITMAQAQAQGLVAADFQGPVEVAHG